MVPNGTQKKYRGTIFEKYDSFRFWRTFSHIFILPVQKKQTDWWKWRQRAPERPFDTASILSFFNFWKNEIGRRRIWQKKFYTFFFGFSLKLCPQMRFLCDFCFFFSEIIKTTFWWPSPTRIYKNTEVGTIKGDFLQKSP